LCKSAEKRENDELFLKYFCETGRRCGVTVDFVEELCYIFVAEKADFSQKTGKIQVQEQK
jgi:hypothetical protein